MKVRNYLYTQLRAGLNSCIGRFFIVTETAMPLSWVPRIANALGPADLNFGAENKRTQNTQNK